LQGILRTCQLPLNYRYGDIGWPTRKIRLEAEVSHVCFFPEKGLYGIAATEKQAFRLPEDDNHKEWVIEETAFPPKINRGYLKLLHPTNWTVIDRLALDDGEICISMTVANLEVSEVTHERRPFVCIGTMVIAGEDQQTRGKVYVLDVPDVVPEPDRPETGHKFKVHAKEDVKGGVTALAEIGPQGFLLVAQGQKCLVRGLIETDKLLPVAIMDVQCFVTVAKVLKGTGMILLGDIAKGLWFTGYTVSD
jgi:cleavage and polyadenylation specificity factor subunit 1